MMKSAHLLRRVLGGDQRNRWSVRFAALVALSLGFAFPFIADADPASAGSERVFQWNIQGGCSGTGNCGGLAPATTANYLVALSNPKPLVLTFNEVCGSQYSELYNYLSAQGYQGRFQLTAGGVNCGTNDGTGIHGNAIFQPGAVVASSSYYYVNRPPTGDVRGLYCLTTSIFGLVRNSCVTHLDNSSSYTSLQNGEAAWIMTAGIGSTPTKLGGDLNSQSPASWGAFNEVDAARAKTFNAKGTLNQKLDWFFGSKANHTGFGSPSRYCNAALSDHCALGGIFYT